MDYIFDNERPIYVQLVEKIRDYLAFVSSLGYTVTGDVTDSSPKSVQNIIKQLEDKPEFKILSTLLLRSMQKAVTERNWLLCFLSRLPVHG